MAGQLLRVALAAAPLAVAGQGTCDMMTMSQDAQQVMTNCCPDPRECNDGVPKKAKKVTAAAVAVAASPVSPPPVATGVMDNASI